MALLCSPPSGLQVHTITSSLHGAGNCHQGLVHTGKALHKLSDTFSCKGSILNMCVLPHKSEGFLLNTNKNPPSWPMGTMVLESSTQFHGYFILYID